MVPWFEVKGYEWKENLMLRMNYLSKTSCGVFAKDERKAIQKAGLLEGQAERITLPEDESIFKPL